jgi:hypothetical protein
LELDLELDLELNLEPDLKRFLTHEATLISTIMTRNIVLLHYITLIVRKEKEKVASVGTQQSKRDRIDT